MRRQACAGFDFGERTLHLAVREGVRWGRMAEETLPEGLVREGRIVSFPAMAEYLKGVRKRLGLRCRQAAVVLPESLCPCRRLSAPALTLEQLRLNLPYEFRDYLEGDRSGYVYDCALLEETSSGELELLAAAASRETIRAYTDLFRRAGFRLTTAVPEEMACTTLIRFGNEAPHSHAILDLGHRRLRLALFSGDRFESARALDWGCGALEAAVAEQTGVDLHLAAGYLREDFQGVLRLPECRRLYEAMALELRKAVNFHRFHSGGEELAHIHCCGGGVGNPALLETLAETLGVPLLGLEEFQGAGEPIPPGAAAAAGAALQGGGSVYG